MTSVGNASQASRQVNGTRPTRPSRLRAVLEARHSRWTAPVLLWLASRLVSTVLLLAMYLTATGAGWTFASHREDASFLTFSGSWDASFYRIIAEHGYPTSLPFDDAGHVLPNAWAFLPVFPWVVRAVMATGLSFWAAGVVVSLAAGLAATIVLYRLVFATGCSHRARWATALFVFGPLGFLLQVSYAEGLFLALSFGALLALVRRRYWLIAPLGLVAAFTRPGVLALALALAVHLVLRWVDDARGRNPFPWRERIMVAVTGLLLAAAGLAWPLIATAVTRAPDAYLRTELSWWTGFVGRREFAPLTPWFVMAGTWLGPAGIVLVVVLLAGAVWFLCSRSVRALGRDVWAFAAAYLLYLVAVFLPQQSLPRLLMPTAPLLGSDVFVGTRRRAMTWLVVGLALQPVAIVLLWFLGYP